MKRLWWIILPLFSLFPQPVQAYYGAGQVLCNPIGYFVPITFNGDSTGFGQARDLCIRRGGGSILVGPGMEGVTLTYPKNANITVIRNFKTGWSADPFNLSSIQQGGGYVLAYSDSGFAFRSDFPGSGSGIQSAINWVNSTGGGKVVLGIGVFPDSIAIGLPSNVWLQGSGMGLTTIKRVIWNPLLATDYGHGLISIKPSVFVPNKSLSGGLPADSLINITVTDLTIDGNFQSWPTENPNTQGGFGIQFWYTDNVRIENVEIKNTGQTGIELDACRNSTIRNVHTLRTGLEQMLGTRNGININNNSGNLNVSVNWGRRILVENCFIINQKDAGIDCANVSEVKILNNFFFCDHDTTYGNMVHEWEGSLVGYTMHDFIIENSTAIGHNNEFFQMGINGANLKRLRISSCYFEQGDSPIDSTRARWPLLLCPSDPDVSVEDVTVENCVFENLNAGGAGPAGGAGRMLYFAGSQAATRNRFTVRNCTFKGVNQAESNSSNIACDIAGNISNVTVEGCKFYGVEDVGFYIHNDSNSNNKAVRDILIQDCYLDGAMKEGFLVGNANTTGIINGVKFINNVIKDTNGDIAGASILINGVTNGEILRNVRIEGNRLVRTSGTNMEGIKLSQSGTAVVDSIWILNNDVTASASNPFIIANSPTNFWYNNLSEGQFLDNNDFIYWRHASTNVFDPVMKVDSTNTLRIYPGSGGNIDLFGTDGTVRTRFYGTGGVNSTNSNSGYQLGGFTYLQDNGNERRIFMKNDATGSIIIRNQANNATLWTWNADGSVTHKAFTFATLPGTPANGTMLYCSDCTIANPTAGGGTGAFVKRLNGVWIGN